MKLGGILGESVKSVAIRMGPGKLSLDQSELKVMQVFYFIFFYILGDRFNSEWDQKKHVPYLLRAGFACNREPANNVIVRIKHMREKREIKSTFGLNMV